MSRFFARPIVLLSEPWLFRQVQLFVERTTPSLVSQASLLTPFPLVPGECRVDHHVETSVGVAENLSSPLRTCVWSVP